jgi:hypothetical protein
MTRTIDHRFAPRSTWTAICRPDDPHKTLVDERGALLYGYAPLIPRTMRFTRVVEPRLATDHQPVSVTQVTESADVPVVVTTLRYPNATLTLRSVGHLTADGHRYDVVLWDVQVSDEVDELLVALHVDIYEEGVLHAGASWQPARVVYALPRDHHRHAPHWRDDQAPEPEIAEPPGRATLVSVPHRLRFATPTRFRPASALETVPDVVPGGERLTGALVLPLDDGPVDHIDLAWATEAVEAERRFWIARMRDAVPIEVPDPSVQDMLRASARNILQAREEKDGELHFQVGSAVYRGLWMVDGHFLLEAARYLHLDDDARRGLEAVLARAKPDGSIVIMDAEAHHKETGIAIATIVRQCELAGDDETLKRLWPVIRHASDYIETLRDEARALPPDHPAHGLMPPAFADGGAAGARPELTTALWCLAGLRMALDAAQRVAPEDAALLQERFTSLRDDLLAHACRHTRTRDDGTPYVPMILPGSGDHALVCDVPADRVRRHDRVQPATATWALAHAIWPGEVFPADHEIVRTFLQLLDTLDDEEGIPAETGWLTYRSVWTYYASFAAHAWLYAGRPDKAVDYLYAFANHAGPTRVWREEQSLAAAGHGRICGDMPHNWASAEFIRLVRHLLVWEANGGLELLPGLPTEWLRPGAVVRLDRTPTRFGPVSLEVAADGDGGRITLAFDDRHRPPSRCVLHVPAGSWTLDNGGSRTRRLDGPARVDL